MIISPKLIINPESKTSLEEEKKNLIIRLKDLQDKQKILWSEIERNKKIIKKNKKKINEPFIDIDKCVLIQHYKNLEKKNKKLHQEIQFNKNFIKKKEKKLIEINKRLRDVK